MRAFIPEYELKTPASLDEALRLLAGEPGVWRPFAGGTDLMVLLEAGRLAHRRFLSLWGLLELRGIAATADAISIGAMTTYAQIQRNDILRAELPMLVEAAGLTGAAAIQNRGTIGGNIANASPAADSLPALLVYEAEIELVSAAGSRRVAYRDFHTGYKTTVMRPEEVIYSIHLPRTTAGWRQYSRKVGTRKAQAISKVCIAAMAKLDGDRVKQARIAYGSVAPAPVRAVQTEAILQQRIIDDGAIADARDSLRAELRPIDDVRSTAVYRAAVAANLLEEFLMRLRTLDQ
jgi:CO/xanthine dehydrogenase FAD-binding subunit